MLLKTLSELNGTSGVENEIRQALRQEIEPFVDSFWIDKIGNLIVEKKSTDQGPKVMLAAHMDEVALMITDFTADGLLRFRPVGGIDSRVLVSKPIKLNSLIGVIGAKAIHLQKPQERQQALKIDQLYIDIGAKTKEEAEKHIQLGDYAYFLTETESLGEGFTKGKAFDDRVGCYVISEILKKDYTLNLVAAFTVQEEVGLRGAKVAAYHVQPDFAIVLEGTVAADMVHLEEDEWVTELGKGPALSIMDHNTLYNPKIIEQVAELAKKNAIPLQFRRGNNGGNDAGKIHLSREGIPTITISVPCRYIHSTSSIISEEDVKNTIRLVDALLQSIPTSFTF